MRKGRVDEEVVGGCEGSGIRSEKAGRGVESARVGKADEERGGDEGEMLYLSAEFGERQESI